MNNLTINNLPEMIASNTISLKEGINELASFVSKNYKIFGLQKFDEDFRSEIFISILEKGENIFQKYNKDNGDFFNYLFCFINSQVKALIKRRAKFFVDERLLVQESISNYDNYVEDSNISYICENTFTKVPYQNRRITSDQLKEGLSKYKLEKVDKTFLVFILRTCFDLNDNHIQSFSITSKIDENLIYDTVQYLKETLISKKQRLDKEIDRRNSAYYRHKKYEDQIILLKRKDNEIYLLQKKDLEKRNKRQLRNLTILNNKFESGYLYLRPTTREIADLLGICERQVCYYLKCIKDGKYTQEFKDRFGENIDK